MKAMDCINGRASVRSFRPDPLPDQALNDILRAATRAPSAGNVQDWEFVVVKKQDVKDRLARAAFGQAFVAQAPVVVVVCSNLRSISNAYGERGKNTYSVQNAAAATQNMLLAAWEKGIGSCWVGAFNEEQARETLVLPSYVRPLAIVPLGYPAAQPRPSARKSMQDVLHHDFY